MSNKSRVLSGLLVAVAGLFIMQGMSLTAAKIEWEKSPGAVGYIVEISDSRGKIKIRQKTNKTFIEADLRPGSYKVKISPLNKFNKPEENAKWTPLEVRKAVEPEIRSISKTEFHTGSAAESVSLTGKNLIEGCGVFLIKGDNRYKIKSKATGSADRLTMEIDPAVLSPGWFDLEIVNPGDTKTLLQKKILITDEAVVLSISSDAFSASSPTALFSIKGERFIPDCYVELKGPNGTQKVTDIKFESSEKITVMFNPSIVGTGSFELFVVNPGAGAGKYSGNFFITLQPETESANVAVFLRNQPKQKIFIKGKNYFNNATVKFKSAEEEKQISKLTTESGSDAFFEFEPSSLSWGKYELIVENPGSPASVKNILIIITADPKIESIAKTKFRSDNDKSKIEISGTNFIDGAGVILKKEGGTVHSFPAVIESDTRCSAEVNPAKLGEGSYELVFVNPGDRKYTSKKKINILRPLADEYRLFIGFSGGYTFLLPEWRSLLGDTYVSGNIYAGYHLMIFSSNPVLRYVGAEFETGFSKYENTVDLKKAMRKLMNIPATGGVYAAFDLFEPVDIILRGGGGGVYTKADLRENGFDEKVSALSLMLYGGFSARYQIYEMLFAEAGADYRQYFFDNNPMHEVHPYIRLILSF